MNNIYGAPAAKVTRENTDYEYVGFWVRVLASIIDNIWLGVVIFVLWLVLLQAGVIQLQMVDEANHPANILIQVVLPFVTIVALWARYAATPGKMVFKAKILDAKTFEPVPVGRLVLRYVGYLVCVFTLLLGFVWVAFDSRKQGLHDKIAGTVVVRPR